MTINLGIITYFIIFIITSIILPSNSLISRDKEDSKYESVIEVAPAQCLEYKGAGRGPGSSYQLIFSNRCSKRLYVNVCVEERPGKFRLHKSASKVPKFGQFNIFTHEGSAPLSVAWASSPGNPEVPKPCKE